MLNFLKHKWTRKEKIFAKWGVFHFLGAFVAGLLLALLLMFGQRHADKVRVQGLEQDAGQVAAQSSSQDTPLPPRTGKIGGAFVLMSQDGNVVSDKDFSGKYLLIYFGYTSCPDICPTGLKSISIALDMLKGQTEKVQPLFITVDPVRDTPTHLKQYDSSFNSKIIGLTGSPDQIASVAKEYQVYYKKGEGDQDYEVEHSNLIYLMDPNGDLVATFDEEVDPQAIVLTLQKDWARNHSPTQP